MTLGASPPSPSPSPPPPPPPILTRCAASTRCRLPRPTRCSRYATHAGLQPLTTKADRVPGMSCSATHRAPTPDEQAGSNPGLHTQGSNPGRAGRVPGSATHT
eukprot:scaffold16593_cov51-Phaeocystis_antarctica.AAC.2